MADTMENDNCFERIVHNGSTIAIILYSSYKQEGVQFLTPPDFALQLGHMVHVKGTILKEHTHNSVVREIQHTYECILIKKGRVRVNLYSDDKMFVGDRVLQSGDTILLVSGGHGFNFLEDTEIVEVKQGPYLGDKDKIYFEGALK